MRGNKNVGGGIFRGREAPHPPGPLQPKPGLPPCFQVHHFSLIFLTSNISSNIFSHSPQLCGRESDNVGEGRIQEYRLQSSFAHPWAAHLRAVSRCVLSLRGLALYAHKGGMGKVFCSPALKGIHS